MEIANNTNFIVSIDRKESLSYYSPLNVWIETNEEDHSQVRFCTRGEDSFGFRQRDITIVS